MRNLKRAIRDTARSIKRRGLPELGVAGLLFVGMWATAHEVKGVRQDVSPLLAAFAVTAWLFGLYLLVVFVHHFHLAGARAMLERLAPGPDAVAAEQRRIRELRAWVGMLRTEVRDVRDALVAAQNVSHYWDPVHAQVRMRKLAESGGLLATEPRTDSAYQACDELRRKLAVLSTQITERWYEECGVMFPPDMFFFKPPVEPADDLPAAIEAACQADRFLSEAMRSLDEATT